MEKRWAPASTHGNQFETFVSDPNNLYRKTLDPLDPVNVHQEGWKRTSLATNQFKSEQGSII